MKQTSYFFGFAW